MVAVTVVETVVRLVVVVYFPVVPTLNDDCACSFQDSAYRAAVGPSPSYYGDRIAVPIPPRHYAS